MASTQNVQVVVAGITMQDGGLVVMGENNSLRVFESSHISPIVDE